MGLLDKIFKGLNQNDSGVDPLDNISGQTRDELNLVGFIKHRVEQSRMSGSRIAHEGIWMTNIAYLLGFDGVFFDTNTRQFRTASKGNYSLRRNRVHLNTTLPTVQNRLSRLCKNPPKYDVLPNSSSNEDKESARLAITILEDIWDRQEINQKRVSLFMMMQQSGHAYLKPVWDDQLGEMMMDPSTGEMDYEGDIRVDVVSPFEIFPDPLAKTLDECQWIIHAKVRKLDYFKTHYPERGALVKEEGVWLLSLQYDIRVQTMSVYGQGQTGNQPAQQDCAIELVYYEKRSRKHPNGRMVVSANGVLLEDKELPVGEIPLVKFDDIVVGGKYYSESIITHLRPIQDQQNRNMQMRAAWANRMLAGKYLVPKGSGLSQEQLNDQSGEVLEYNAVPGAPPPQALNPPVIPAYAFQEEDRLNAWVNNISGIGEISRGNLPSAGIPAIGMQYIQEQDETRLGVVTQWNEHSWARLGRLILKYVDKYYITPRILKIAGPNMEYAVQTYTGEDLKGHFDVKVIPGSTIPGSKVLKRQEILNLYNQGLLGEPQDPKIRDKVLSMLEYGDIAEVWKSYAVDIAQINKQIKDMEQGIPAIVNQLDNHQLHVQEKNEYRKQEKFATLPPEIQQLFMSDIQAHIDALTNLANPGMDLKRQQLQMQMAQAPHDAAMIAEAKNPSLNPQGAPPPPGELHPITQPQEGATL